MIGRDPAHLALRRAGRVAIVAPAVFAFLLEVVGSDGAALFGAFGSFALLAFADLGGDRAPRTRAYVVLTLLGATLVAVGTLTSANAWVAAAVMVLVGFAVRFAGSFGGYYAASVSPLILAFVLGATVPATATQVPARVGGWLLAGAAATIASLALWPHHERQKIRLAMGRACDAFAGALDEASPDASAAAKAALAALRREVSVPQRPGGPAAHDVALAFAADELERLAARLRSGKPDGAAAQFSASALRDAACALLVGDRVPEPDVLAADREADRAAVVADAYGRLAAGVDPGAVLDRLDDTFTGRACEYLAASVAVNTAILVGGRPPAHDPSPLPLEVPAADALHRLRRLFAAHASPTSTWLRGSLRAGVALGLAVLVAGLSSVDHGFWVVLGTLSVLRSNAFDTGRTALEAAAGTAAGFAISALLLAVIGLDRPALWVLVVVGYFAAAYLPQVAGFVAGQAAFTVLVVALFNLFVPVGWRTGLVRVEDVAIGVTVSAIVAVLFWPRRAVTLLRDALAELYRRLGSAIARTGATLEAVRDSEVRAHAAYAQYLDETGRTPAMHRSWAVLLAVAGAARAAAIFVVHDRRGMHHEACGVAIEALDGAGAALASTLEAIAAGFDGVPFAPNPLGTVAERLRDPVVSCLAAHAHDAANNATNDAAISAAFEREWLGELARLLPPACDALRALR